MLKCIRCGAQFTGRALDPKNKLLFNNRYCLPCAQAGAEQYKNAVVFTEVPPEAAEIEDDDDVEKARYRARAKERYEREGEIEIDANAQVSMGDDNGAYVQAWVWVEDEPREESGDEN
jgi:hypothetical protein